MRRRASGYTLMELMVSLAILGILAALGYPAYLRHVIKANRADAQSQLVQAGQYLERYYATHDSYTTTLPAPLSQSPATGTKVYDISASLAAGSQTWTLTAMPVSTASNRSDGKMQLDSQRNRYWDANNDGVYDSTTENTWTR